MGCPGGGWGAEGDFAMRGPCSLNPQVLGGRLEGLDLHVTRLGYEGMHFSETFSVGRLFESNRGSILRRELQSSWTELRSWGG
jgi:hypothetical protein